MQTIQTENKPIGSITNEGIYYKELSVNEFTLILQWKTIEPWLEWLVMERNHNTENHHNPTT